MIVRFIPPAGIHQTGISAEICAEFTDFRPAAAASVAVRAAASHSKQTPLRGMLLHVKLNLKFINDAVNYAGHVRRTC